MNKKIGYTLYAVAAAFLLIKLIITATEQYGLFIIDYSRNESIPLLEILWSDVIYHGLLIEPILILISLIAFMWNNKIGYYLTLIFPYFIIAYAILDLLSYEHVFGPFNWAQMTFAIFVIVPLNIPATVKLFKGTKNYNNQIIINVLALVTGFGLNLGISEFINSALDKVIGANII